MLTAHEVDCLSFFCYQENMLFASWLHRQGLAATPDEGLTLARSIRRKLDRLAGRARARATDLGGDAYVRLHPARDRITR